ncbi:unnamed protein product [Rhodiola kirilowii]
MNSEGASSFSQPSIPKFDGDYEHWSLLMENLLYAQRSTGELLRLRYHKHHKHCQKQRRKVWRLRYLKVLKH